MPAAASPPPASGPAPEAPDAPGSGARGVNFWMSATSPQSASNSESNHSRPSMTFPARKHMRTDLTELRTRTWRLRTERLTTRGNFAEALPTPARRAAKSSRISANNGHEMMRNCRHVRLSAASIHPELPRRLERSNSSTRTSWLSPPSTSTSEDFKGTAKSPTQTWRATGGTIATRAR